MSTVQPGLKPITIGNSWTAISAMFVLNGALFGIWASRIPAIATKFSLSHSELGVLLLTLAAGAVCSFQLAGRATDRFGAAKVTKCIALLYPVTLILLAFAPDQYSLTVALFMFGAAHGSMDVAMNSWGAEVERQFKQNMMSSFHAMFSVGAGLGSISGYIALRAQIGLPTHFLISALAVTALTFYLASIPWVSKTSTQKRGGSMFVLPSGSLILVGLIAFCASLGEGAMVDWSAVYLRDVVLTSESTAALGYAVFSVAMVVVRLFGDVICRKTGPVNAARFSGGFAVTGTLLVILFPYAATVLAGFIILGIGYAVIMPLAFSRAANDPLIPPGQAVSSVATLGYGGLLLGPPMIGFIAGFTNLQIGFGVLLFFAGMMFFLAPSLKSPVHRNE